MALSTRDWIGRSLEQLSKGLKPFVSERVTEVTSDLPFLLRTLTEDDRFSDSLSRSDIGFAHELHQAAERFGAGSSFSERDTQRMVDTSSRLLRSVGAVPEADAVETLLDEFLEIRARRSSREVDRTDPVVLGVEGHGLKPWREVIRPHRDIREGNFNASQFAANLYNVVTGKATDEYGKPAEFFRRTYLTEGLKDLLGKAIRRVSGDINASPVINLRTNFGGGKTHSMLALYHIFSADRAADYPQEIQELAKGIDLTEIGSRVRRVVISGQDLSPKLGILKDGGVRINTLWGEVAWQLGGHAAFARLAGADETGTPPGREVLQGLIADFSPCLVLIDEWVAYARLLYSNSTLPAGTFDAQFTFAQVLTEAVSSTPGAMLAVTVPASDIEVGGINGQQALIRLQNVVRRIADPWKAATAKESFEIVRRRLFEEVDAGGLADIAATARTFVRFYGEHRGEFPPSCANSSYEEDIRAAYPIHPELFQRLYDDWSALERFQRTRGVLSLMSNVIQVLLEAEDPSPMIMPATVPLRETRVGGQLAQYLDDSWAPVINRDIEGINSTPATVDHDRPLYGHRAVTQRLARTIFIGSAATLRTPNKGIDKRGIWLGSALPGDTLGHFDSALHLLTERATYLYAEGDRYWYDTSQSVTKTVRDIADRFVEQPELAWQEIVRRLQNAAAKGRESFADVRLCPTGTDDIPDDDKVRLVIIHPEFTHRRGDENSDALKFARDAVRNRGTSGRKHANMLVFVAADTDKMVELMEGARDFCAWNDVEERVNEMNLSAFEQRLVGDRRRRAHLRLEQLIQETYCWTLVPDQPDGGKPAIMSAIRTDNSQTALVQRVSERLTRIGKLADQHAPKNIRYVLQEKLSGVWEAKGFISVAQLWELYTRYSYMPRLKERSVLLAAVGDVLQQRNWVVDGFALASYFVNERFESLAIPDSEDLFGDITESTLLVVPERALAQRSEEELVALSDLPPAENDGLRSKSLKEVTTPLVQVKKSSGFHGVLDISGDRYGKMFKDLQLEILAHLNDPETDLTITVDIRASRANGFSDEKVQIVSENAGVLKFRQSHFED